MILDLGCGQNKYAGAVGVDISPDSAADHIVDLVVEPLPFGDNTFDGARSVHSIEHIPFWMYDGDTLRRPMVDFLKEVYRVLKPGGEFYILTLAYPDSRCFQDPDHKSVWTLDTIRHFVGGRGEVHDANDKRIGLHVPFQLTHLGFNPDKLLEIRLRKPK